MVFIVDASTCLVCKVRIAVGTKRAQDPGVTTFLHFLQRIAV